MPFDLTAVSIMFKGDWKADKYDSQEVQKL